MKDIINNLKGSYFMIVVACLFMWGFLKFFDKKEITLENGDKVKPPNINSNHIRNIIVTCLLVGFTVYVNNRSELTPSITRHVNVGPAPF